MEAEALAGRKTSLDPPQRLSLQKPAHKDRAGGQVTAGCFYEPAADAADGGAAGSTRTGQTFSSAVWVTGS